MRFITWWIRFLWNTSLYYVMTYVIGWSLIEQKCFGLHTCFNQTNCVHTPIMTSFMKFMPSKIITILFIKINFYKIKHKLLQGTEPKEIFMSIKCTTNQLINKEPKHRSKIVISFCITHVRYNKEKYIGWLNHLFHTKKYQAVVYVWLKISWSFHCNENNKLRLSRIFMFRECCILDKSRENNSCIHIGHTYAYNWHTSTIQSSFLIHTV